MLVASTNKNTHTTAVEASMVESIQNVIWQLRTTSAGVVAIVTSNSYRNREFRIKVGNWNKGRELYKRHVPCLDIANEILQPPHFYYDI